MAGFSRVCVFLAFLGHMIGLAGPIREVYFPGHLPEAKAAASETQFMGTTESSDLKRSKQAERCKSVCLSVICVHRRIMLTNTDRCISLLLAVIPGEVTQQKHVRLLHGLFFPIFVLLVVVL